MKRPKRKQKSGNRATGTALKRMEAVKSPSEPPTAPNILPYTARAKTPHANIFGAEIGKFSPF